jgi:hypothetical protein
MDNFHAVKGINEDSFGYNFIEYTWIGAEKLGPHNYKLKKLSGEDGIKAHQCAVNNRILLPEEISTGDIDVGPGPPPEGYVTPAMGTEPSRAKKKRKKGGQILFGDKKEEKK